MAAPPVVNYDAIHKNQDADCLLELLVCPYWSHLLCAVPGARSIPTITTYYHLYHHPGSQSIVPSSRLISGPHTHTHTCKTDESSLGSPPLPRRPSLISFQIPNQYSPRLALRPPSPVSVIPSTLRLSPTPPCGVLGMYGFEGIGLGPANACSSVPCKSRPSEALRPSQSALHIICSPEFSTTGR